MDPGVSMLAEGDIVEGDSVVVPVGEGDTTVDAVVASLPVQICGKHDIVVAWVGWKERGSRGGWHCLVHRLLRDMKPYLQSTSLGR